ncbi:MAG: hypothetical protein RBT24_10035 [Arcobacteraceae bacterium]|jgi:hypothetical protein|nr:hypothetical protein [Arcobacteraceae bacterium]
MPYKVVKREGKKPYKIVNKDTGKAVGSSTSKAKAEASVRARLASEHDWKRKKK